MPCSTSASMMALSMPVIDSKRAKPTTMRMAEVISIPGLLLLSGTAMTHGKDTEPGTRRQVKRLFLAASIRCAIREIAGMKDHAEQRDSVFFFHTVQTESSRALIRTRPGRSIEKASPDPIR
jgi:hypothetical protein